MTSLINLQQTGYFTFTFNETANLINCENFEVILIVNQRYPVVDAKVTIVVS